MMVKKEGEKGEGRARRGRREEGRGGVSPCYCLSLIAPGGGRKREALGKKKKKRADEEELSRALSPINPVYSS